MYADRVETAPRSSIKDRLNGGTLENSGCRRQVTGKRLRQGDDDKWEHDLFEQTIPQVSSMNSITALEIVLLYVKHSPKWHMLKVQDRRGGGSVKLDLRVGAHDLRLKLQKKNNQQVTVGVRDLREKLSVITYPQSTVSAPAKAKAMPESSKPARKSIVAEAPVEETKKVASTLSKKKKGETVDTFLQSLGLEKYSITFQAEEVDMTALLHMTDEDLKAIGIPMGPRKKILLALESKA